MTLVMMHSMRSGEIAGQRLRNEVEQERYKVVFKAWGLLVYSGVNGQVFLFLIEIRNFSAAHGVLFVVFLFDCCISF